MNQLLFEQKMFHDLGINYLREVLDIGCGRGRVACYAASSREAKVKGMDLDPDQLASANRFAQGYGLSWKTQFKQGDMNSLPLLFKDNSFTSAYYIQALNYSKDLGRMFKDIHRILKPGGKIASLCWVTLDKYDP